MGHEEAGISLYLTTPVGAFFELLGWLYLVQLSLQLLQALIRVTTRSPGNIVILLGHSLLGLTGDATPKRPFLKHPSFLTYSLLIPSFLLLWLRRVSYFDSLLVSLSVGTLVAVAITYAVSIFGAFTIFKLYPEGYGAGFNLYWKGWRVLGLDWHQWVIRQDLKTRKPLAPEEQYALNRPHIDLPLWEYHHWPWTQFPHSSEVAAVKAAKDALRAASAEKKAERKARRAAVLASRSNTPTPATSDAQEEGKEKIPNNVLENSSSATQRIPHESSTTESDTTEVLNGESEKNTQKMFTLDEGASEQSLTDEDLIEHDILG